MDVLTTGLLLAAVVVLGLSAGALLAEAAVLVPFWRAQPAAEFLDWYERHASLLLRFFGALEVASTILIVAAAGFAWQRALPGWSYWVASAALTLAVLAAFPLYFQKANASFAERTIAPEALSDELARWSRWHSGRTLFAVAAFALPVFALTR